MNAEEFISIMLERKVIISSNTDLLDALERAEEADSNVKISLARRIVLNSQRLKQLTDDAVDFTKHEVTKLEEMARENQYTNPELYASIQRYRVFLSRITEYYELLDEQTKLLKETYGI